MEGEWDSPSAERARAKELKDLYRTIPFNNYLWTRAATDMLVTNAIADYIDGGVQRQDMLDFRKDVYGQEPLFEGSY